MDRNSESERRERTRRARYLSSVHEDLPVRVARAVVAFEQGWSSLGAAKLPDIDVSNGTAKKYLNRVVEDFGSEAVFAKPKEQRKGPLGPSERLATHMTYDPDELKQEAEQNTDAEIDAKIINIEETTAGEIYNGEAQNPDREVIQCEIVASLPSDDVTFTDTFSLPKGPQSWGNPNFKLGKFHEFYGDLPTEGMSVTAVYNDDGFLRVKVEGEE